MTHLLLHKLPYDVVFEINSYFDKDGLKAWLKEEAKKYRQQLQNFRIEENNRIIYISSLLSEPQFIPSFTDIYRPSLFTRLFKLDDYRDFYAENNVCLCPLEDRLSTINSILYQKESFFNMIWTGNRYTMIRYMKRKFRSNIPQSQYTLAYKFWNVIEWRMSFIDKEDVGGLFYKWYMMMANDEEWELKSLAQRKKPFLKKRSW